MQEYTYEGLKWQDGSFQRVDDALPVEEVIQININGEPFTILMRTPGHEDDLVRGLLYTEDIYRGSAFPKVEVNKRNDLGYITEVSVKFDKNDLGSGYLNSRSILSVSSCGICGKRELGDLEVKGETINRKDQVPPALLFEMYRKFEAYQDSFNITGGSHAAGAFTITGDLITLREDVGRHNAVDKVIGSLLHENKLKDAACMLVSGRVSYEIVTKTFVAGIPVLAAVSAPSSLAVDFSKELGITLFGFCRENRATCYTHAERVNKD